jgi:hypothetical protein
MLEVTFCAAADPIGHLHRQLSRLRREMEPARDQVVAMTIWHQAQMRLASDFCACYRARTPQERREGAADTGMTLELLIEPKALQVALDCMQRIDGPGNPR